MTHAENLFKHQQFYQISSRCCALIRQGQSVSTQEQKQPAKVAITRQSFGKKKQKKNYRYQMIKILCSAFSHNDITQHTQ